MVMSGVLHKAFLYPKPNTYDTKKRVGRIILEARLERFAWAGGGGSLPILHLLSLEDFFGRHQKADDGRSHYSIPEIQLKDIGWTFMHVTIVTPFVADLQLFYLCFVYS